MKALRIVWLALLCTVCCTAQALGEGFALNEWSARGVSLAGGMVGRADDVSALAYNGAGITQLPGTHMMGGLALIAPQGSIVSRQGGQERSTFTKPALWPVPHAFASHQLNDRFWLGLGVFSRFGLGNSYDENWVGRYNVHEVGLQTVSFVPTLAVKLNDIFSVSLGVETLYAHMHMGSKVPTMVTLPNRFDNDMRIEGSGWGVGVHTGLHMRFNDQWSVGASYKSQITLNITGNTDFAYEGPNVLSGPPFNQHLPYAKDCSTHATLQLPDSLALGVTYRPLENLSFEVGTVWTRWSTYNALNIYMDNGYAAINNKKWRDGWNFNASVEYKPLDWWTLRAGFSYETPVVNENHSDYLMPTNGRQTLSLGTGVRRNNWTLDLAYAHLWINSLGYGRTDAKGIRSAGIQGGALQRRGSQHLHVLCGLFLLSSDTCIFLCRIFGRTRHLCGATPACAGGSCQNIGIVIAF